MSRARPLPEHRHPTVEVQDRTGLLGNQPWGHLIIEVHPDNPAIVVAGAMNLVRSSDFGVNWTLVMDWQNWSRGDRAQPAHETSRSRRSSWQRQRVRPIACSAGLTRH